MKPIKEKIADYIRKKKRERVKTIDHAEMAKDIGEEYTDVKDALKEMMSSDKKY